MMRFHLLLATFFCVQLAVVPVAAQTTPCCQMERLDRGVVALPAADKGIFVSWRVLGTDDNADTFTVLRNGKPIAKRLRVSNYTDAAGTAADTYQVVTARKDGTTESSAAVRPWGDLFMQIPLNRPQGGVTPDGRPYTYRPNDCSVGDVDGDGAYEIILKWDPSNSKDNSFHGYTGDVVLDCYKMDGTQLWRVNLGKNIRAGAHYTQFLVYDFDGDGKAEMVCKTAPGSVDGTGRYVSMAATEPAIVQCDNAADYRTENGRILSGEEFLTVFRGTDGKALHTIWYRPNRNFSVGGNAPYGDWGDKSYQGNRGERFLACVAYLDGADKRPSAVMCRGYYTPSFLWTVDFDGQHLSTKWLHSSLTPDHWTVADASGKIVKEASGLDATAYGQGAHSLSVGDVDGDGCDEIIYGAAAINNDGTLLYSTGLGHGDAQHLGDLDPDRPGMEYYMVHEHEPYGEELRDARTGEILFRSTDREDTGRGLAADIDAAHRGYEYWCSARPIVRDCKGGQIARAWLPMNFRIYWDGDLQDELLGNYGRPDFKPFLMKWNGRKAEPLPLSNGKHFYEMGHSVSCNWSKATPCLQADLLGDWREEIVFWDSSDASHLNVFTTNTTTDYRVPTLMHDHVYRMAVAWQNVAYNQPPHLGFYLPDAVTKWGNKISK